MSNPDSELPGSYHANVLGRTSFLLGAPKNDISDRKYEGGKPNWK